VDTLHVGAGTGIYVTADYVNLDYTGDPPFEIKVQAADGGVAPDPARVDHAHNVVTDAPISITDSTNSEGAAVAIARSDHGHAHGDRGGGTLHDVATISANGFMSATDKVRLNALADATPDIPDIEAGPALQTTQGLESIATVDLDDHLENGGTVHIRVQIRGHNPLDFEDGAGAFYFEKCATFRRPPYDMTNVVQVGSTTTIVTHTTASGSVALAFSVSGTVVSVDFTDSDEGSGGTTYYLTGTIDVLEFDDEAI
jgi:hypothetical protein